MQKTNQANLSQVQRSALKSAQNCVAYARHLKLNNLDSKKTVFENLPLCDKDNYTAKYSIEERIQKNKCLSDFYMICTSSGSTAEPTIWPRDYEYDRGLEPPHTKFLNEHFAFSQKKTLVVIAFGLGTTQAGMMHLKSSWEGSLHGQISVIAPNGDAEQTVFLLNKLHPHYEQIIVIGYPPIISDFIDLAEEKKLDPQKWNLKIVFAGESVSPLWRKTMAKKIGGNQHDIVSFYGSTEAGMIGFESKEINQLIAYCLDNEDLRFDLFKTFNLPTLVEVNFDKKYVEIVDGEIVVTADQAVPLVRYNLHDRGFILDSKTIQQVLNQYRIGYKYPKNQGFLVIYGRNLSRQISIEDVQNALAILNFAKYFHKEFQYQEKINQGSIILSLTLYAKNDESIAREKIKSLEVAMAKTISKLIMSAHPVKVKIKVLPEAQRLGYKSGKLRYL